VQKYINLFEYHFSYLTDISKLAKLYVCNNCGSKFRDTPKLTRHGETCKLGTINTFESEDIIWTEPRNIIIEICDYYNITNTDFKYDYLVTFDLESILLKTPNSLSNTSKLKFISTHVAVSASNYLIYLNLLMLNLYYQLQRAM